MDAPEPTAAAPALGTLFAYPFRAFFAAVALIAVLAVPAWLAMLLGGWQPPSALPPLLWHQHEMVFAFVEAAVAGFLLTAVCVWTSTDRLHGAPLAALFVLWVAGRVTLAAGGALPLGLAHAVDLAFLPLVALDAGRRIVRARQSRHAVILVVLAATWLCDLGFHLTWAGGFVRGGLVAAMALMLVVGGRITPAFSANWLRASGGDAAAVRIVPALDLAVPLVVLALVPLAVVERPAALVAAVAALGAVLSGVRLVLWRGWLVRSEPLLWILHAGLAWIPVALALLAASALGAAPATAWLHAAGAGAAGTLILGVMSRVALGHTGRPLRLPAGMTLAFGAVVAAGAVRVLTALHAVPWQAGLYASAALWMLAFGTFLVRYAPVLASPRVDGRPG